MSAIPESNPHLVIIPPYDDYSFDTTYHFFLQYHITPEEFAEILKRANKIGRACRSSATIGIVAVFAGLLVGIYSVVKIAQNVPGYWGSLVAAGISFVVGAGLGIMARRSFVVDIKTLMHEISSEYGHRNTRWTHHDVPPTGNEQKPQRNFWIAVELGHPTGQVNPLMAYPASYLSQIRSSNVAQHPSQQQQQLYYLQHQQQQQQQQQQYHYQQQQQPQYHQQFYSQQQQYPPQQTFSVPRSAPVTIPTVTPDTVVSQPVQALPPPPSPQPKIHTPATIPTTPITTTTQKLKEETDVVELETFANADSAAKVSEHEGTYVQLDL